MVKPVVLMSLTAIFLVAVPYPCNLNAGERRLAAAVPDSPTVVSRNAWGANPALPGLRQHRVSGIIIHHTATLSSPSVALEQKMRALQSFSQRAASISATARKPIWPDIPYHFYIDVMGKIAEGRDVHFAGDSNTNYDPSGYLQLVIEGNFDREEPTPAQIAALRGLLIKLLQFWHLHTDDVSIHNDHARTACPGRHLMAVLPALLTEVRYETGVTVQ